MQIKNGPQTLEVSKIRGKNKKNLVIYRNRNRNKFINQIRAPGGHIQITIMIE